MGRNAELRGVPPVHGPGGAGLRARLVTALGACCLVLGGCASLNQLQVQVSTPAPAPQALVGARIQVQAAPDNAASADAPVLQAAVLEAMTRAGMVPLLGQAAPYAARYAFHSYVDFQASFPSAWPPPGPPVLLPDGSSIYSGYPWWWRGWSWPPPWYERVFEIEVRDVASGALVWRTSALSGGFDSRVGPVAALLADAALQGFPGASGNRTLRVPAP